MPSLCKTVCAVQEYRGKYDLSLTSELWNQNVSEETKTSTLFQVLACQSCHKQNTTYWLA
jgi:cytochrome c551/c552